MSQALIDSLGAFGAVGGLSGLAAVLAALRELRTSRVDVRAVRAQVEPNHGSSLADSVRRTEASVTDLSRRMGHELGEIRRDVQGVRDDLRAARSDHESRLERLEDLMIGEGDR